MDNLDDLIFYRLKTLENIKLIKLELSNIIIRRYDKRSLGVWKLILPIGSKVASLASDHQTGKGHIILLEFLLEMLIFMRY